MRVAHSWMIPVLATAMSVACLLPGCSRPLVRFVDSDRAIETAQAREIARKVDLRPILRHSAASAPELRQQALTELRSHGDEARALADALTITFPADYAGVPVHVESVVRDSRDLWLIVEVVPSDGAQTLDRKRYWLLDRTSYDVVESGSFD